MMNHDSAKSSDPVDLLILGGFLVVLIVCTLVVMEWTIG
jgi:hypothetical protein